jgi:hypothetical protein
MLGEITFVENEMDYLRMEGVIAMAKQEIETLELEEKVIKRQLEAMKNVGGISFWPKPILHPIF